MRTDRRLLLVEDDDSTRELLCLLLEAEGWQVTAAENGDSALQAAKQAGPAVVLSDLQMPGLSGSALAAALRPACGPGTIVLAMTATVLEGPPPGFDALLVKPFAAEAVLERCNEVWSKSPVENPAPVAGVHDGEEGIPVIATDTLQRLLAGMPPAKLRPLYDFALQDAEMRVDRMAAAAQLNDDAGLRREAHALKGSCGMIGALRLQAMASAAEVGQSLTGSNPLSEFRAAIGEIRHMLETLIPG